MDLLARLTADMRRRRSIAAIGRTREAAAIPHLLPLLPGDASEGGVAAQALAQLLRAQPVMNWSRIERLRGAPSAWSMLASSEVERLGRLECGWAALALASMHTDGQVRAAAVGALARREDGGWPALASLLVRLNDWAAPIRTAARAAIEPRLTASRADEWVAVLPLVLSLAQLRRDDHGWVIAAVDALLRAPAARPAVLRGAVAPDPEVRLACVRLLLVAEHDDAGWDRRYLFETEPRIRRGLAAFLRCLPDGPRWPELAALALRHRERVVQQLAHAAVLARPAAVQRAVYERLLADRRRRARGFARAAMRALEPRFDAAAWYRGALATTHDPVALAAMIQGYGECEEVTNDEVLAPYSRHATNRVKAAANIAATMIARRRGS